MISDARCALVMARREACRPEPLPGARFSRLRRTEVGGRRTDAFLRELCA